MVQLHFLPVKTAQSRGKTKREQELEDLEARSYAAQVSHARAGRGPLVKGKVSETRSTNNRSLIFTVHTKPSASRNLHTSPITNVASGPLDPFFTLPAALDSNERILLHLYLSITPRVVYGLAANPTYCPVRDAVVPEIATNALFMRWILYVSSVTSGASTALVLSRRAGIYRDMMRLLASPAELMRDSTLMVLLGAGIAENRSGNFDLADKHYAGALGLLRNYRGGLRAIQNMKFVTGMGVANGILMQDVKLFETRRELMSAMSRMTLPRGRCVDRRVWRLLGTDLTVFPSREVAFHVANLHMMNMMAVDIHSGFWDDLVTTILGSGERVMPSAITFMICACAVRAGEWYGEDPQMHSWETLEFARLIMYAPEAREPVVRTMSGWLMGSKVEWVDLEETKKEILEGWDSTWRKRRATSHAPASSIPSHQS